MANHTFTFVALDCETTGFIPESDRIIEVGCTKFSLTEDLINFDVLTNPGPGIKIPTAVVKLTGITDEELVGAPVFSEQKEKIDAFARGHILVGHNLVFDLNFLRTHGVDLTSYPTLDTYLIAGFILPRVATLSLAGLAEHFGLTHESAHRALSDAEATRDLLRVLIEIARRFPREKWEHIAKLETTAPTWLTTFAEIVLHHEMIKVVGVIPTQPSKVAAGKHSMTPSVELCDLLDRQSTGIQLIESTSSAEEIAIALRHSVTSGRSYLLSVAKNFAARELAKALQLPIVIAPRYYADQQKVVIFTKKILTPIQAEFAAKLILHEELNYFEFNLTRAERLDWDFVSAETIPAKILNEIKQQHVGLVITQHDSLPELSERYPALLQDRTICCTEALALPKTIAKSESLTIDLITLEKLLPEPKNSLTIWWGLLGMLIKEAEPLYGFVDLANANGLASYARMCQSGKSFLEEVRDVLPNRVVRQLLKFIDGDTGYARRIRTDQNRAITLMLEKNPDATACGALIQQFAQATLLDDVLATSEQNFSYARGVLGLPNTIQTQQIREPSPRTIELLTMPELPLPSEPDFQKRIDTTLTNLINTLPGVTVIYFSSRTAMAQFFEKQQINFRGPVVAEKISGSAGKVAIELRKHETITLLTTSSELPARTANLIVIRLPFTMSDNADWKTETLPLAVINWRRLFVNLSKVTDATTSQRLICLDNRLTNKGYGKDFYLSVGCTPTKLNLATGI